MKAVVRARVDQRVKQEAEAVLEAIGVTVSDAVRLMILRVAQDKALPFKPPILPDPKPIQKKEFDMSKLLTPAMRQHVAGRTHDHFGFSGYRAAIACLYARPEGASQDEVNEAAAALGSPQKGFFNMLRQGQKWGHRVLTWDDTTRGKVYKLVYETSNGAPRSVAPPSNCAQMNKTPYGVTPQTWRGSRRRSRKASN
jgi:addiction module RelB/DinJ family antitoxin